MELSFVANAIRRRPWIVLLCAMLGVIPGFISKSHATKKYESKAVVLVSPPTQGQSFALGTGNDRYVENQLSVLQSTNIAERVATEIGDDLTRAKVEDEVTVIRQPGTDLVNVIVSDDSPDRAQRIAKSYVQTYITDLKKRADAQQAPEIKRLDNQLTILAADIETLTIAIDDKMKLYLPPDNEKGKKLGVNETQAFVPTVEQIASTEQAKIQTKLKEQSNLIDQRSALEQNTKLKITSEIVQDASLPLIPTTTSRGILIPLGFIAGALFGAVIAAFVARMSTKVLDGSDASKILKQPIVGSFGRSRSLVKSPKIALARLPTSATSVINELCVRAEGTAEVGRALTIAVVGTQRGAGTTTLAVAMAGRFANQGNSVLLIDGDARNNSVSRLFQTTPQTSIPALLAEHGSGRTSRVPAAQQTEVAEVRIVGLSDKSDASVFRRDNIADLLQAASRYASVVIVDGGPVLDAATTLHLCKVVDAVVLAVPVKKQSGSALDVVRQQLTNRRGALLPVLTHPGKRQFAKKDKESVSFVQADASVVVETESASTR